MLKPKKFPIPTVGKKVPPVLSKKTSIKENNDTLKSSLKTAENAAAEKSKEKETVMKESVKAGEMINKDSKTVAETLINDFEAGVRDGKMRIGTIDYLQQHGFIVNDLKNKSLSAQKLKNYLGSRANDFDENHESVERCLASISLSTVQRYRYMEPFIRMHQALEMLNDISESQSNVNVSEFYRVRVTLRQFMLQAHKNGQFQDALSHALTSLELSRKFYTEHFRQSLTGDMALELLVICHCCSMVNCLKEGLVYLKDLRQITENTLRQLVEGNLPKISHPNSKNTMTSSMASGSINGPVLKCDGTVLCHLLSRLAELCLLFKENQAADTYYNKYTLLAEHIYGVESLTAAEARNVLAFFYYKTRRYADALKEAQKTLEIRKKKLGDFWKIPPNEMVAESYCNVGILLRLTGQVEQALNCFYTALDMQLRLSKLNRNTAKVQDIILCVGIVSHQTARFREAMELYTEVYNFRRNTLGVNHPDTQHVMALRRELEKDVSVAHEAVFKRPLQTSPRGTSQGLFVESVYGPNFVVKSSREEMLRTCIGLNDSVCVESNRPIHVDSMTSRLRALYGDEIRGMYLPSTVIHPFFFGELVGPDILTLASTMDCIGLPHEPERPPLPVINVPMAKNGVPVFISDEMKTFYQASERATALFCSWGLKPPIVDKVTGEVLETSPSELPDNLPLALPLWDSKRKAPMKGIEGQLVMVPNPGIAHFYIPLLEADSNKPRPSSETNEKHRSLKSKKEITEVESNDNCLSLSPSTRDNNVEHLKEPVVEQKQRILEKHPPEDKLTSSSSEQNSKKHITGLQTDYNGKVSPSTLVEKKSESFHSKKESGKSAVMEELTSRLHDQKPSENKKILSPSPALGNASVYDKKLSYVKEDSSQIAVKKKPPLATPASNSSQQAGATPVLKKEPSIDLHASLSSEVKKMPEKVESNSSPITESNSAKPQGKLNDSKKGLSSSTLSFNSIPSAPESNSFHKKVSPPENSSVSSLSKGMPKPAMDNLLATKPKTFGSNSKISLLSKGQPGDNVAQPIKKSSEEKVIKAGSVLNIEVPPSMKTSPEPYGATQKNLQEVQHSTNGEVRQHSIQPGMEMEKKSEKLVIPTNKLVTLAPAVKTPTLPSITNETGTKGRLVERNEKKFFFPFNKKLNKKGAKNSFSGDGLSEVSASKPKGALPPGAKWIPDDAKSLKGMQIPSKPFTKALLKTVKVSDDIPQKVTNSNILHLQTNIPPNEKLGGTSILSQPFVVKKLLRPPAKKSGIEKNTNEIKNTSNFRPLFKKNTEHQTTMLSGDSSSTNLFFDDTFTTTRKAILFPGWDTKFNIPCSVSQPSNPDGVELSPIKQYRITPLHGVRPPSGIVREVSTPSDKFDKGNTPFEPSKTGPNKYSLLRIIALYSKRMVAFLSCNPSRQKKNGIDVGIRSSEASNLKFSLFDSETEDDFNKIDTQWRRESVFGAEKKIQTPKKFEANPKKELLDKNIAKISGLQSSSKNGKSSSSQKNGMMNNSMTLAEASMKARRESYSGRGVPRKVTPRSSDVNDLKKNSDNAKDTMNLYLTIPGSTDPLKNKVQDTSREILEKRELFNIGTVKQFDKSMAESISKRPLLYVKKLEPTKDQERTSATELKSPEVLPKEFSPTIIPGNGIRVKDEVHPKFLREEENVKRKEKALSSQENPLEKKRNSSLVKEEDIVKRNVQKPSESRLGIKEEVVGKSRHQKLEAYRKEELGNKISENHGNTSDNYRVSDRRQSESVEEYHQHEPARKSTHRESAGKSKMQASAATLDHHHHHHHHHEAIDKSHRSESSERIYHHSATEKSQRHNSGERSHRHKSRERSDRRISPERIHQRESSGRSHRRRSTERIHDRESSRRPSRHESSERHHRQKHKHNSHSGTRDVSSSSYSSRKLEGERKVTFAGSFDKDVFSRLPHSKPKIFHVSRPKHEVSLDVLKKAKAVNASFETIVRHGKPATVPCVILVDNQGDELVRLPWRVDMEEFLVKIAATAMYISQHKQKFPKLKFLAGGPQDVFHQLVAGSGIASFKGGPFSFQKEEGSNIFFQHQGVKSATETQPSVTQEPNPYINSIGLMQTLDMKQPTVESLIEGIKTPEVKKVSDNVPTAKSEIKKSETTSPMGKKVPPSLKNDNDASTGEHTLSTKPKKGPPKLKGAPALPKTLPKMPMSGAGKKTGVTVPVSKTKKLFWDPINNPDGTVWEDIEPLTINQSDVEAAFAKTAPKTDAPVGVEKKPRAIQILPDSKRSYNMSIALSRFNNLTFAQLRNAVIDLKPEILNYDASKTLITFSPLPEECAVIEEYIKSGAELSLLDKPEQYVAAMLGVPLFKERLECHQFALQFIDLSDTINAPLDDVDQAVQQLRNSASLKVILSVALEIGNTMNKGAEAQGFRLSTLNKLCDIRTVTKPVRTLLQYIVDVIFDVRPEKLELQKEIPSVEKAARVEWNHLESLIAQVESGYQKMISTIEKAQKNNREAGISGNHDPLVTIFQEFCLEAQPRVEQMKKRLKEVQEGFVSLACYFGETEKASKTLTPKVLFGDIARFGREVELARKDRYDKAEREKRREAAAAAKEKRNTVKVTQPDLVVKKEEATTVAQVPKLSTMEQFPDLKDVSRAIKKKPFNLKI